MTPHRTKDDVVDLSMNEGDLPPRECLDLLQELGPAVLRDYVESGPLERAYADYLGVPPDRVLATTGGDDAIDRVFRAFLAPEEAAVFPTPTFEMVPACARMVGGRAVALEYEWGVLPHDAILGAVTETVGMVVVLTPDNPTGRAFSTTSLVSLARALPDRVTLLVDMAYVEFAEEDPTGVLLELPNVLMVRTMSKAWGLAGLRVGFVIGPPSRIETLRQFGGPYPLNGPGVAIALHRLESGRDRMREFVVGTRESRARLARLIGAAGGEPGPSETNFILARFDDVAWVQKGLAAQGILTRWFEHLPDHLRITVPRSNEEMERVERAFGCLGRPEVMLFDLDGVLADVRRSYRAAIIAACGTYGVEVDDARITAVKAGGHANDDWELTRTLLSEAGVEADLAEVTHRFEEAYQGSSESPGLRRHETLIPDRSLLEELSRSFRLGIVTGRPRADATRFLDEQSIGHLFEAVVCREDGPLKPDPEPVRMALREMGADTAWLFGDTPDDVHAATAAGVVPIGVVAPGGGAALRQALARANAARIVDASDDFGGLLNGR